MQQIAFLSAPTLIPLRVQVCMLRVFIVLTEYLQHLSVRRHSYFLR